MPLIIVSWNVNSLRSAIRNGFCAWLEQTKPDFVCLQEVRATISQLRPLEPLFPGYKAIWHPALRPGYAGTGILSKFEPITIEYGLNNEPDPDGRALTVDLGPFRVTSLYAQNAIPGTPKIEVKCAWFEKLTAHIQTRSDKPLFLCGDLNITHSRLDSRGVAYPTGINGCTDEERTALKKLMDACQIFDPHREKMGETVLSTWWHAGKMNRQNNNGIRFDYTLLHTKHRSFVQQSVIHSDVFGSDHCPTSLTVELPTQELRPAQPSGQVSLL